MSKRRQKRSNLHDEIPEKANRILNLILVLLVLISLRLWHLAVIQYDARVEESQKPQKRHIIESARRATIRDRFNHPLAINKIQYQASILYSQLRSIPSIKWIKSPDGKRIKQFKRKEYIAELAKLLSLHLGLDSDRVEDLIHSKAAMYYNMPFILKEEISEKEYYRLKMLEKDWPGIHVQILPKRTYPMGRTASDIIGYMGAINRQEFETILQELKALDTYIQSYENGDEPAEIAGIDSVTVARKRYKELQERAYTVNDYIGKTGIEGRFEEELRGFRGKKSYYSDAAGNFLRELPGSRAPLPGNRLLLTISTELQEYAEHLLIKNERIREAQLSHPNHLQPTTKQPWIKGGAIIAIDPNNGEILTLASYPRIDPNDFISSGNLELQGQKRLQIQRWFESEDYIGQIWDRKRPLERERFDDETDKLFDEPLEMGWKEYIDVILPKESALHTGLNRMATIKDAIDLQRAAIYLQKKSQQENYYRLFNIMYQTNGLHIPFGKKTTADTSIESIFIQSPSDVAEQKKKLDRYFSNVPQNYDKVLLLDLSRLIVAEERFSEALIANIGKQNIKDYRDANAAFASLENVVKELNRTIYHEESFREWRKANETAFIKEKRSEETASLKYPKPYIDYLDQKESQLFNEFWNQNKWNLITLFLLGNDSSEESDDNHVKQMLLWHHELENGAHQSVKWISAYISLQKALQNVSTELCEDYLKTLRSFHDLDRPLYGRYRYLRKHDNKQLEKHLASAFYPQYGYGYGRSYAYRQAAIQGSLFKLVTAYTALVQKYKELDNSLVTIAQLNPLEIVDLVQKHGKEVNVGFHLDGTPISQYHKGGRLPKSSMPNIGRIDLIKAIEVSSNPYFSLLASEFIKDPKDLINAAKGFSYGTRTGIDLPGEISGHLPKDLHENKTGLYSFAIGQHSLVVTPLQASVMLSALANGGKIVKPKIVKMTVNSENSEEGNISIPEYFDYQDSLALAGIDFPLFTAISHHKRKNKVMHSPTGIRREIFMPDIVRRILLEGMHRVVVKMHTSISGLSRFYQDYPEAISDYIDLKDQLVGKTSTAESMENIDLDLEHGTNMYTHVWFGGISFENDGGDTFIFRDAMDRPELVVVVYLRFGHFGRETAPVAAQIIKKWREIKEKESLVR